MLLGSKRVFYDKKMSYSYFLGEKYFQQILTNFDS